MILVIDGDLDLWYWKARVERSGIGWNKRSVGMTFVKLRAIFTDAFFS
jgi:hypothetical protein